MTTPEIEVPTAAELRDRSRSMVADLEAEVERLRARNGVLVKACQSVESELFIQFRTHDRIGEPARAAVFGRMADRLRDAILGTGEEPIR